MRLRILFSESERSSVRILGRSAEEYLSREFADFPCERGRAEELPSPEEGETLAVIPLDMPLVTVEDVREGIARVRKYGLKELMLGGAESGAKLIVGGEGRTGYTLASPHFVKVDSAKNRALVYNQMKERVITRLLEAGVFLPDPSLVAVDDTVTVSAGAELLPFCRLEGDTTVAEGARIEGAYLKDCVIGRDARVLMSHLTGTRVGARSEVGPFARLRDAVIGEDCRIGDFVEVKNSSVGEGAKSAHLAYIGDADVGAKVNVGCGTVFCNYDGKNKHRTAVGDRCFIGANVNLVAPLRLGEGSFVAAGTTVTEDVPSDAFVIGRSRQTVKTDSKRKNT